MTRACFRCSDSGVGNKKSVFLLISLCTVQPIIARYHEIRCSPPIIAPYLHIRISNLPYPSYPYIQLAISFMSSYDSYPYIRNAISLIFSYPYITASHSLAPILISTCRTSLSPEYPHIGVFNFSLRSKRFRSSSSRKSGWEKTGGMKWEGKTKTWKLLFYPRST